MGLTAVVFEQIKPLQQPSEPALTDELIAFMKEYFQKSFRLAIYTKIGQRIIFLVAPHYPKQQQFSKQLKQACTSLIAEIKQFWEEQFSVGIGRYQPSALTMQQSYTEALQAINIGRNLQCQICCFEQLGVYRLLSPLINTPESKQFQAQYLTPLMLYDQKKWHRLHEHFKNFGFE